MRSLAERIILFTRATNGQEKPLPCTLPMPDLCSCFMGAMRPEGQHTLEEIRAQPHLHRSGWALLCQRSSDTMISIFMMFL